MPAVQGWYFDGEALRRGQVTWEDGQIQEVGPGTAKSPLAEGIILPAFFNAHTHLADAVVEVEPKGTVEELVAPPAGLKHRVLAATPPEILVEAMAAAARRALATGTTGLADFREGGTEGALLMQRALGSLPMRASILGRPRRHEYEEAEVEALLRTCPGLGLSAARDWPPDALEKVADHVHRRGAILALHASEAVREDIDSILDLKPAFLVHMTVATKDDLVRCAEAGVPVAICPRSQAAFGRMVDIPTMVAAGVELMLGTDNAMLASPSMLRELEFAHRIARVRGGVALEELLAMAWRGKNILSPGGPVGLEPGQPADFVVLRTASRSPDLHRVLDALDGEVALVETGGKKVEVHRTGFQEDRP